mmetsp:Transcript_35452/g.50267  ORF Transcript_35452/g.50267 Transcript_35452/m.50267 type:complete len:91 (+) Transcript_35452:351-623(+)
MTIKVVGSWHYMITHFKFYEGMKGTPLVTKAVYSMLFQQQQKERDIRSSSSFMSEKDCMILHCSHYEPFGTLLQNRWRLTSTEYQHLILL